MRFNLGTLDTTQIIVREYAHRQMLNVLLCFLALVADVVCFAKGSASLGSNCSPSVMSRRV